MPSLARLLLSPPACRDAAQLRQGVQGQTVLVTGASYGIGEQAARLLAGAGATVLLLARSPDRLQEVAADIGRLGGQASVYALDLSQPADIAAVAARIQAAHPRIDAVISNAGKSVRRPVLESAGRDDLGRSLAVNFSGPAALLLALLPRMVSQGGGQIVSVSTVAAGPPGWPRWASYQGSKAGFDVWLQSLGAELSGDGVRVSSVYLPLVRTRMSTATRLYDPLPALSAQDAAGSVLLPLVRYRERVAPWWLWGVQLTALLAPGALGRLLGRAERLERRWTRR